MTASEFVRGLIRLTASGRAKWRLGRVKPGTRNARAYLALGKYTFVLTVYGNADCRATLVEMGDATRPLTVLDAPDTVEALATQVRAFIRGRLTVPVIVKHDGQVEDEWADVMRVAESIMTREQMEQAESEIWRRK